MSDSQKSFFYNYLLSKKTQNPLHQDLKDYGYDIVISIKSIYDLQAKQEGSQSIGFKVQKFNKELDDNFKKVILVGMLGNRNKGKSFLCNMLIGQNFPSDFHISTPGICLKYHSLNDRNIVYLDSKGGDNPIKIDYQKNQNFLKYIEHQKKNQILKSYKHQELFYQDTQKCHEDLKATQQIQQEFIIENSDIIIILVSIVSIDDQRFIHDIISKANDIKNQKQDKRILVIHNLKEFKRPEYVKNYIQNELKNIFPLNEQSINLYKTKNSQEHHHIYVDPCNSFVNHVVIACQGSEAGNVYNGFGLNFIKNYIGYYQKFSDFTLQDKLLEYLNKNLEKFVKFREIYQTQTTIQQEKSQNFVYMCNKKQAIFLREGLEIERTKEQSMNVFGVIYQKCKYSLVKCKNNDKKLILLVEIPGSPTILKKFEKQQGKFTIIVTKNKQIEESLGEIQESNMNYEQNQFTIQIAKDKELWNFQKQSEEEQNLKNGFYKYEFIKEEEEQGFQ